MCMCVCVSYISQTQAGPQAVYDILSQVRVVWVPHQPDGHDLRWIHQHPADAQHLPAVTLWRRPRRRQEVSACDQTGSFIWVANTVAAFCSHEQARMQTRTWMSWAGEDWEVEREGVMKDRALGRVALLPRAFCWVQNRMFWILPLSHDPLQSFRAHTQQHAGRAGSETAWEHPGNRTLCQTQRSHRRICTNTRRTLPLWAAGRLALALEMAGRYFASLRFRKGTQNTSLAAAAKQHSHC